MERFSEGWKKTLKVSSGILYLYLIEVPSGVINYILMQIWHNKVTPTILGRLKFNNGH